MFPVKPTRAGQMKAMCSRNNNFSNRGQKLTIVSLASIKSSSSQQDNVEQTERDGLGVGGIIGVVIGVCVFVIAITMVVINRNAISKKYQRTKKQVKRSFQSYV
jgi:hypothetical protein